MEDHWLLIPHAQHARIASAIARSLGGEIAPPVQGAALAQALAMHNEGFQGYDAKPSLNRAGEPAGHDEIPLSVLLDAWSFAAAAAAQARPAAAMLLSLLSLQRSSAIPAASRSARELFLLNRHQQAEIQRQQALRAALGIRGDADLSCTREPTPQESDFLYDYRLMLFVIQLTLDICLKRQRDYPPVRSSPGGGDIVIRAKWTGDDAMSLKPFPLAAPLSVEVIGKRVPLRHFDHELELHEFMESAQPVSLQVRLSPGES